MRLYCRQRIVALIVGLCLAFGSPLALAQAATAGYSPRFQAAVTAQVNNKVARWGFAANDPRYKATAVGVNTGMSVIAGVAMSGAAVVSWPVVLAAAGIAAVVAGAVSLAGDSDYKWTWGADGTVTASGAVPLGGDYGTVTPLVAGGMFITTTIGKFNAETGQTTYHDIYGTNAYQLAAMVASNYYGQAMPITSCTYSASNFQWTCQVQNGIRVVMAGYPSGSPHASANGVYDTRPVVPPPPSAPVTPDAAAKAVPDAEKSKKVSAEVIAAAANAAWKAAAPANESGGIPWSASDPITPEEVQTWINANPSSAPTVADFLGPANPVSGSPSLNLGGNPSSGGGGSPAPGGGTGTGTSPGTPPLAEPVPETPVTPGEGQEINWGPNPNIGAPVLELAPTASAILSPGFDLMPSLKNFAVPAHAGTCPTAGFNLYGKEYKVDAHCNLMEQNRGIIGAAMMLAFSLAAVFIVLRA